jgi:hypothetical protein
MSEAARGSDFGLLCTSSAYYSMHKKVEVLCFFYQMKKTQFFFFGLSGIDSRSKKCTVTDQTEDAKSCSKGGN